MDQRRDDGVGRNVGRLQWLLDAAKGSSADRIYLALFAIVIAAPVLLVWLGWNRDSIDHRLVSLGLSIHLMIVALAFIVFISTRFESSASKARQESLALRQSCLWQQVLLDNDRFTVICTSVSGTIRTINPGALNRLGFEHDELINRSMVEALLDSGELSQRAADLTQELGRNVSTGFEALTARALMAGNDEHEWTFRCKSGERFQVRQWVSPLKDDHGRVCGFAAIGMDISEQHSAALALQSSLSTLDERNRELQDFAFVASHDLQEPLRKIRVFSDRMLAEYATQLDTRGRDYLTRNLNAAARMQTLIDDLMAYSRVATHGGQFAMVDLNQLMETVVDDLEVRVETSAGRVVWKDLPCVRGDATQLRQLFQNLISNALKFRHPERAPMVRISCEPRLDTQRSRGWYIRVEDNGIGFDQLNADRIFAPFQRLHGRSEYEGTGIGLAIVRRIVDRHSGRIYARGSVGVGAIFTIFFPALPPGTFQLQDIDSLK